MKRALALLTVLSIVLVLGVMTAQRWLMLWGAKERMLPGEVTVQLDRGESLKEFSRELASKGIVEHPVLFEVWIRLFGDYKSFQAGTYKIPVNYTLRSFTTAVRAGETHNPVVLQFTIPEGFTVKQVAARLAANGVSTESSILALSQNREFISSVNLEVESLEGYLYPATYSFTSMPGEVEVLKKMVHTFWEKLPANYEQRVGKAGLTLAQAVTFASLIELETHHDSERPLVSEVIWNRLNRKIALAIDAAIIYGIEDYAGDIKRKHLEDASNLYNTRKHRGLPPGPIGNPSRKSLEAVLTPSNLGNFYYVLDLKSGKHNFSKTLKEHNRYVQKMLRDRRELRSR